MRSIVSSTITKGRITRIDTSAAMRVKGVLTVLTHENRPPMADKDEAYKDDVAPDGSPFRPLYDDKIMFNGQPIALVVAETSEIARYAASLVQGGVRARAACDGHLPAARRGRPDEGLQPDPIEALFAPPKTRGKPDQALAAAAVRHEAEYYVPIEHHNPMELYASTVIFETRRQAHGLRQDPGRAERAEISLRRVRHEAGGCARHVAIHGRRLRLGTCARSSRWCWRCSRRARCSARCGSC